MQFATSIETSL